MELSQVCIYNLSLFYNWWYSIDNSFVFLEYKLTATGGGNDTLKMIDGNETTAMIENLKAETQYVLRLQAGTVKGLGPVFEITDSTRPPPSEYLIPTTSINFFI